MSWFKKLFSSNDDADKKAKKVVPESPTPQEQEKDALEEVKETFISSERIPPASEFDENNPVDQVLKEMLDESPMIKAMKDTARVKDIPREEFIMSNLDNIFPRLKFGQMEHSQGTTMEGFVQGKKQTLNIPRSGIMYCANMDPDFACCFALDVGNSYQLLSNGDLENLSFTKQELYNRACNNFVKVYGNKVQVLDTDFQGVKMIRTDGDSEASTFLLGSLWNQIQHQFQYKNLYACVPLQDVVVFWSDISETVLDSLIAKLQETIPQQRGSRKVSDWLFQHDGQVFKPVRKVFS